MRYWDTSAIIPLFVGEEKSASVQELLKSDPGIVSWWGTPIECYSSFWRIKRQGAFKEEEMFVVKQKIDRLFNEIDFIAPSKFLRDRAIRLLALHSLKAGDALQLASALRWTQDQTQGTFFITLDEKLREAAFAEGFSVLP